MAGCGISTLIGARALGPWLAIATLLCGPARAQPAPEVLVTATPDAPAGPAESRLPAAAAPQPASVKPLASRPTPTVTSVVDLKAPGGPPKAQIASLGSVAEASQALSRVGDLLVAPLMPEIQPAVSGEKIYYRALVAGFATRADAAAFCAAWKRRGGACFVR